MQVIKIKDQKHKSNTGVVITNTRIGDECYDGKLYTKTSGGVVKEVGGAVCNFTTVTNAATSNDITLNGANLVFEVI